MAIGCGSLFLSHLNDAGFWIVKDCLGLTVAQTFKTWTVCETIVGIVGMLLSLGAFQLMARGRATPRPASSRALFDHRRFPRW